MSKHKWEDAELRVQCDTGPLYRCLYLTLILVKSYSLINETNVASGYMHAYSANPINAPKVFLTLCQIGIKFSATIKEKPYLKDFLLMSAF